MLYEVITLGKRALYELQLGELAESLERSFAGHAPADKLRVMSYFGTTPEPAYRDLARKLFDLFPCAVLEIGLRYKHRWQIVSLKAVSPRSLDDAAQTVITSYSIHYTKLYENSGSRG